MNLENVKVSVILPIYNVGLYFEECMESVLNQSHKKLEVILVNDGSTDNSGEIADSYALNDKRIKVIHQANAGVSAARNVGIANATGEYVCFCDPDDILCADYVDYLLSLCVENNTPISVCAEVFTTFKRSQRKDNVKVKSGEDTTAEFLYGKITVGCYSKMFQLDFLNSHQIRFFTDVSIGEGFNFNAIAFCMADKVAISQHKVYTYRLDNSESAMTKFKIEKCLMGIKAIDIIRENLRIKSKKLYDAVDYAEYSTICSMYDWLIMAGQQNSYSQYYHTWKNKIWRGCLKTVFLPVGRRGRIVASIRLIHPSAWTFLRIFVRRIVSMNKR